MKELKSILEFLYTWTSPDFMASVGDLTKALYPGGRPRSWESAVPQSWADEQREKDPEFNSGWFYWDCDSWSPVDIRDVVDEKWGAFFGFYIRMGKLGHEYLLQDIHRIISRKEDILFALQFGMSLEEFQRQAREVREYFGELIAEYILTSDVSLPSDYV